MSKTTFLKFWFFIGFIQIGLSVISIGVYAVILILYTISLIIDLAGRGVYEDLTPVLLILVVNLFHCGYLMEQNK